MKIRRDFVTNSSSSSFIIAKKYLDEDQLEAIRDHATMMEKLGFDVDFAAMWTIEENEDFIAGYTWMDNLSIADLFRRIDIDDRVVTWGENSFDLDRASAYYYDRDDGIVDTTDWRRLLHEDSK